LEPKILTLQKAGISVAVAENGKDAVKYLNSGPHVDLVFSGIVMPGTVSGVDLGKIIHTRFPKIRVVLATGYSERRVGSVGIRTLAKPYSVAALVTALNKELQCTVERGAPDSGEPG
jgi:DNA-binding NtrC family response regulator